MNICNKYYYNYEKERQQEQQELIEWKERCKKYICEKKQTIDDLLTKEDFKTAFDKLVDLLISVEPNNAPCILQHYYDKISHKKNLSK